MNSVYFVVFVLAASTLTARGQDTPAGKTKL